MKPLGRQLPAGNIVLLLVFILGIIGMVVMVPSFQGTSPPGNGSPALPFALPNLSSFREAMAENGTGGGTPAPTGVITPAATPAPVARPAVTPRSNVTTAKRNVTPFVASLTAMNPAPLAMPSDIMPVGTRYEFKDNNRKQVVSVSVRNFDAASEYCYHFGDITVPDIITVRAKPGHRFLFVEVTWDLIGIVGEGSRTSFMTPAVSSYKLVNRGVAYQPVEPGSIPDILQDAIINFGTLALEESIDKDNPARGVLIFEVPVIVSARESYIEFCPRNTIGLSEPHSPEWDCAKEAVRWSLVP